jgi:hypothetical protein
MSWGGGATFPGDVPASRETWQGSDDRRRRRGVARARAQRRLLIQRAVALSLVLMVAGAGALAAWSSGSGSQRAPGGAGGGKGRAATSAASGHPGAGRRPATRVRRVPSTPAERAVAWAQARARNGMHEIGTTNCSPAIGRWERRMGLPVPAAPPCRPWCGAFVHEAWLQAGVHLSARIIDSNESYADGVSGTNGLKRIPISSVRPGDIVFFALDPAMPAGNMASHEALVVARPRGGRVRTAEGNVGHHAVVTRRGLRYIVLAARVTRRPRLHGAHE